MSEFEVYLVAKMLSGDVKKGPTCTLFARAARAVDCPSPSGTSARSGPKIVSTCCFRCCSVSSSSESNVGTGSSEAGGAVVSDSSRAVRRFLCLKAVVVRCKVDLTAGGIEFGEASVSRCLLSEPRSYSAWLGLPVLLKVT